MYPNKEQCENRLEVNQRQLLILSRQLQDLNKHIEMLKCESEVLHNLIKIQDLEIPIIKSGGKNNVRQ
jgi:hypothetical protein